MVAAWGPLNIPSVLRPIIMLFNSNILCNLGIKLKKNLPNFLPGGPKVIKLGSVT